MWGRSDILCQLSMLFRFFILVEEIKNLISGSFSRNGGDGCLCDCERNDFDARKFNALDVFSF